MWAVVVGLAVAVSVCIWGVASPRSLYWRLHAWQYRDPDANEPSDAGYALTRVGCVILLLVILGSTGWLLVDRSSSQARAECEDELLPLLKQAWQEDSPQAALRELAAEHGLEVQRDTSGSATVHLFVDGDETVMWVREGSEYVGTVFACGEYA